MYTRSVMLRHCMVKLMFHIGFILVGIIVAIETQEWNHPIALIAVAFGAIGSVVLVMDVVFERVITIQGRCIFSKHHLQLGNVMRMSMVLEDQQGQQNKYQFDTTGYLWEVIGDDIELTYLKGTKVILGGMGIKQYPMSRNKKLFTIGGGMILLGLIGTIVTKL